MLETRGFEGVATQEDQASYEEAITLEEIYATTPYPSREVMEQISIKFQISLHKVRCWFNNRRAKTARDNLSKTLPRSSKHSLKRPPTAAQTKGSLGSLGLHAVKARPVQSIKSSNPLEPADRRLSLPAQMGCTTTALGKALKPQRYQAHDDLEQVKSKSEAEKTGSDELAPLLQAISQEANALLTRVSDKLGSNFRTSHCLALLKALLLKAEKFVEHGLVKGLCILVTLARSFAYGLANLNNSYQERTQFSILLTNRLLNAILRIDCAVLPATRRSNMQQTLTFFCKRVAQYDSIPLLQALPGIFLNPWPSKLLVEIMQGKTKFVDKQQSYCELIEVAQARLNILVESCRFLEAANLAKWYFSGGVSAIARSGTDFLIACVNILLKARFFDDVINVLVSNRDRWTGEKVSEWVQRLVDAGSPRHAELLLQALSSSFTKFKY